jgi:hypothetical protein
MPEDPTDDITASERINFVGEGRSGRKAGVRLRQSHAGCPRVLSTTAVGTVQAVTNGDSP